MAARGIDRWICWRRHDDAEIGGGGERQERCGGSQFGTLWVGASGGFTREGGNRLEVSLNAGH